MRQAFEPERITYDFDRDVWVEDAFVRPNWSSVELPTLHEEPGEGRWFRPPARTGPDWSAAATFLGIVATLALALRTTALSGPIQGAAVVLVLGIPLLRTLIRTSQRDPFAASAADLALFEAPDDPDVCLVQVVVWRHDQVVGLDRGVVWFDGGRLLFSGHRTSFAVGGEDVLPRSRWLLGAEWDLFALPLRVPWGKAHLSFVPLSRGTASARQKSRFAERLRVFRLRPPRSRGPRQWPPFGV